MHLVRRALRPNPAQEEWFRLGEGDFSDSVPLRTRGMLLRVSPLATHRDLAGYFKIAAICNRQHQAGQHPCHRPIINIS